MEMRFNNPLPEREKNKDPKIIEIKGRRIMDVDNEEGALIRQDALLFVDIKQSGSVVEFDDIEGVTSHAYMGCAEVIGEFSNGERFYFHSRGPVSLKRFIEKIRSIQEENGVAVTEIDIRGEFGRNTSIGDNAEMYAENEMRQYKDVCRKYGGEDCVVKIEQESITGLSREKVVGYSWTEDRP